MLTNKQVQMFESVARSHPQLREFLVSELEAKTEVLVHMQGIDQLRMAQGHAQCLKSLIQHLDAHLTARR